jgi:hypothetical protein
LGFGFGFGFGLGLARRCLGDVDDALDLARLRAHLRLREPAPQRESVAADLHVRLGLRVRVRARV